MVRGKYLSPESVQGWQATSPLYEHCVRLARGILSIGLFSLQLPLVALDTLFGTTFYGRPSWGFGYRALRLLGCYLLWSANPGTRPATDVLSDNARKEIGTLPKDEYASVVEVPPRPDKIFGDAKHDTTRPESCPCFWQWVSGMESPLADSTPMVERKVMMYFVGGGMVQGHPVKLPIPWHIMKVSKIPVFGVNFRKCVIKETAFPAALQDAVAGFYYLLDQGFLPENICIMGDSGGGGIAMTTLLYLRRHDLPRPGSAILISPFVDLVDDFQGDPELLNLDFLNPEMCSMVSYQYTENRPDLRSTLLSPARGDLPEGYTYEGFPKTLMSYGDVEMFKPGIIELVGHLRAAGVNVEVVVGEDQVHDYPIFTKDRSEESFYGRIKPFLEGRGRF